MSTPSSDQPGKPALPVAKPAPLPLPGTDAPPPVARRAGGADRDRERTRDRDGRRDRDRDDPPRRRRRRDDDDDAPKKGSAWPAILIAGGAVFVVVLLVGGVLVAVWMKEERQAKADRLAEEDARYWKAEADRKRWENNDPWNQPAPEPEGWPPGGGPPGGPPGAFGPGGAAGPGMGGMPGANPWDKPKPPRPAPAFADITPHAIKPAPLADDKVEVNLPGAVGDTCSGGGGRFFIAHITGKKQLAVFDVNEAKVVKYIALSSDTVQIAAGMNKLIVAYPAENTLVRYDLTTFDKEATEKVPGEGSVKKVALGSASAGPLLVARGAEFPGGQSKLAFLDPNTLAAVDIELENGQMWREWGEGDHLRASPDGGLFTAHGSGGLLSIVVRGGSAKWFNSPDAFGHATPGPDGNVYTGYGLYSGEFKRVGRTPPGGAAQQLLPAAEGMLYLQLITEGNHGGIGGPGGGPGNGPKVRAEVRMCGDERPLHTFKDFGPFATDQWGTVSSPPIDRRVHFAPAAKLLVSVPAGNTKLVLRKFDLDAALDASGVDYLAVTSRPPTAVPGKGYDYQIAAKSKKGGLTYKLDAGPVGLTVSAAGRVSWTAPNDFTGPEPVIITVSDASGQEVYHTFELTAGDGKRFAGPISGTAKPRGGADDGKKGLVPLPDRVFELKAPNLQQKAEVKLPGAADAVCAAGGGRFVVYRIPSVKQLAVLDVVGGRVVKYLPLTEADALFTAGMTKLFVFNKSAGVLLRYDLETFDKELTAASPLGGTPTVLLMGHASDGPLFVGGPGVGGDGRGYGFVSARTLKELTVTIDGGAGGPAVSNPQLGGGGATGLAVSPDGRTYCWADNWGGGSKVMTLGERSAKVKSDNGANGMGAVVPGPDGTLFGATGLYTADMKKVGDGKKYVYGTFAPATSGPWYVSVVEGDRFAPGGATPRKVTVGLTGEDGMKFPLDSLSGLPPAPDQWGGVPPGGATLVKVPLTGRLHLVPEAEVLAVLDDGMEKVFLHRLALKPLLDKADTDYLMVVSKPPPAARGGRWAYTPEVWSKKGGVKVKLESGPDGMKEAGGTLTWDVPNRGDENEAAVLLTVSDASGRETFHAFTVAVRADAGPAAAVIRPKLAAVPPKPGVGKKPADPPAFALKPTAAKDGTDVALPAAADFACLAGGGRFILFRIPSKREVAVFDVVDGKVVKQLPLAEEGALVAGGRTFAVVVNPKAGVAQRWNLSTFEKDATTKLPDGFAPATAVMGHASDGPLLLGATDQLYKPGNHNGLYDPITLKKVELKSADPNLGHSLPSDYSADALHASPDGRVFAWRNPTAYPTGAYALVLDGPLARTHSASISAGPVLAGADGHLYTGAGVFSADLKKLIDPVSGVKAETWGLTFNGTPGRGAIPASDGPWYLWLPPSKFDGKADAPPVLKMTGVKDSLATLKDLRGVADAAAKDDNPFDRPRPGVKRGTEVLPFHRRAFLIPAAELLAVLSPDGTKIHLHAFKARDLLDKSGQDYLLVMGRPPQHAPRGAKWSYTPDVWSKKGGVKVELVSGPPAMKADGAGVAWDVPDDLLDTQVTIELKVSDASGKSHTLRFPLSLD